MSKSHHYAIELKKQIINAVNELAPNPLAEKVTWGNCPQCSEKESYFYIYAYKYGRCQECMHEDGFEYYQTVMADRLKEYNKIKNAIDKTLLEV
ncbi:hypothetical protein [Oceanobacillus sp. FSL W7-1309]|uniref:hypothetical protein n=1 Tax=Oceanobacillus sp. FSL W7-1309 TaxID=2954539 RepID=UPI0030F73196